MKKENAIVLIILSMCLGWFLGISYKNTLFEIRAKDLNLMHYDSKSNDFIMNDSVCLNNYELHYLQTGTTNLEK